MPLVACPECSKPLKLPDVPSCQFVDCPFCSTRVLMPFHVSDEVIIGPSVRTPAPVSPLRLPPIAQPDPVRPPARSPIVPIAAVLALVLFAVVLVALLAMW